MVWWLCLSCKQEAGGYTPSGRTQLPAGGVNKTGTGNPYKSDFMTITSIIYYAALAVYIFCTLPTQHQFACMYDREYCTIDTSS